MIDISKIDNIELFRRLYNAATSGPMGTPSAIATLLGGLSEMTYDEAKEKVKNQIGRFDYVNGKVMKITIHMDSTEVDEWLYDRDNGHNAVKLIVDQMPEKTKAVEKQKAEKQEKVKEVYMSLSESQKKNIEMQDAFIDKMLSGVDANNLNKFK